MKKSSLLFLTRILSAVIVTVLFLFIDKAECFYRNRPPTAREWEIYGNTWSDHIHPLINNPPSFIDQAGIFTSSWYLNNISESDRVSVLAADIVLQPLLQSLKQPMTDAERVDKVNQWICDRMIYDAGYLNVGLADAVVKGKGVCWHYAFLFQILMEDLGLEAEPIEGIAFGNSHVWNRVIIAGKEYYFDVSWNDSQGKMENGAYKNEWMARDHVAIDHHENRHLPIYASNVSEFDTESSPVFETEQMLP